MANILSFRRNKLLFVLTLLCSLTLSLVGGLSAHASAADCDDNAIIKCGFSSPADFKRTVLNNDSGNGHKDLPAIYAHYGLEPADYDRFVTSAKAGTAYKDGRIVVGGQTVATNAKSIGRLKSYQGSNPFAVTINGNTYWGNTNDQAFASNSLPVTVLFNDRGVMQFAVIDSCGNPAFGTNLVPTYSCDKLHKQAVDGQPGTFRFTTDASAANNAKIVKMVYHFGDGSEKIVTSNFGAAVTHTYQRDGTYTARVSVFVSLPGNPSVQVDSSDCVTQVTVALPFYQCTALAVTPINGSKYRYKFVVTGKAGNGATFTTADFKFGDGTITRNVTVGTSQTATTFHKYENDGSYTASVTLHVRLPNGDMVTATGSDCVKTVPVAIPYYNCSQISAPPSEDKVTYVFTVSANFGNGVKFNTVDFDFGDNSSAKGVKPTGTSATAQHRYNTTGNYRVVATLHFSVGTATKSASCAILVTPTQPPTPECKPGIPQGSALCAQTLCATNSSLQASDKNCQLPNTGAGSFVAVFGAAVVAGFFIFRQYMYKKHAFAGVDSTYVPAAPNEDVEEPADSHEPVVVKPTVARNSHGNLHHPAYHKPHRFHPRSHHKHES